MQSKILRDWTMRVVQLLPISSVVRVTRCTTLLHAARLSRQANVAVV